MEIETLFADLSALPSIPKVALELIQQFDSPSSSLDAVARNISLDPVIAAKVLRLANSSRYRGSRESTSIEDAASRLGFNTLRTLVLASAVTGAFKADATFNLKAFWVHSFQVASISRLLAKQAGEDADTAFTCGMMHNIGELLIQTGAPQYAPQLNHAKHGSAAGRVANETLQLGFGYPEVGAELARRWQLPKLIQNAIALQARPHQAPADNHLPKTLAQAVLIAEALQAHGGATDEAKESLSGPLIEELDLDKVFDALPAVLEADKAFGELLS